MIYAQLETARARLRGQRLSIELEVLDELGRVIDELNPDDYEDPDD